MIWLKNTLKAILPNTLIRKLAEINGKYFDGYSAKSYSQEGEDMVLKEFFNGKKNGLYIDVGAHHPKRFSNTYLLYKQGWKGINIDAMPGSMIAFNKARPLDINIEKPIFEIKKTLTYYRFNEPALNGFSKELSEKRDKQKDYFIESKIDLETSTLEEILDIRLPANQEIDFISIDVEGLDFMVLKSNNFNKYKPKMILIEILGNSIQEIDGGEVSHFLKKLNYVFFARTLRTAFFIHIDKA